MVVSTLDFRPTLPVVILSKFALFVGRRGGGTLGGLGIALKIGV